MTDETINKNIVISDFLSFVSHKWKCWPLKELLNILQDFYSISDASNAFKTLIKSLPNKKYYLSILDKSDETNIFKLIILFMDFIAKEDMPIFVCKDLCNIPSFNNKLAKKIELFDKLSNGENKEFINDQLDDDDDLGKLKECCFLKRNCPRPDLIKSKKKKYNNNLQRSHRRKPALDAIKNKANISYEILLVNDEEQVTKEDKTMLYTSRNKHNKSHLEAVEDSSSFPHIDDAYLGQSSEIKSSDVPVIDISDSSESSCKDGNETFSDLELSRHKVLKYKCHLCKDTFPTKMKLKTHSKLHRPDFVDHRCPLCFARIMEKDWLLHVHNCPGDGTASKKEIYCYICNIFYADPSILKYHMSFHDEAREYVCVKCNFRFLTKKALDSHSKSYIITERSIKCPFCLKYSDSSKHEEHIRSHTGDRPYKCHVCDLFTTSATRLNRHILTHKTVKKKKYTCEDCGNVYQSYNKILLHIQKAHTTDNPLKCGVCGESFKTGKELGTHYENEHMGLKNSFLCPYGNCNFVAKTAGDLGAHISVHTKSRPFKCNFCDYGANHKSYLTWHIRCHHSKVFPEKK